jgi:hypothetical protein
MSSTFDWIWGSPTITAGKAPLSAADIFADYLLESGSHDMIAKYPVPKVKRIIFNDPATIVFWEDGTKTVVKCMQGYEFSEYYGFVCALAKKLYGSNSKVVSVIKKHATTVEKKPQEVKADNEG